MEELLPYYERELGFLRRHAREFAERYPKVANQLLLAGEVCEDPHIERMIQSYALLNARVSKRLDDDYPEFTEALLEVLYPHYLRPFPSCSIAHMDISSAASQLTAAGKIPRGTELTTRPVNGVACRFRTIYDVAISPLRIADAAFEPIARAPESIALPPDVTSTLRIRFEVTAEQLVLAQASATPLRIFIDGEPSFCAALRDTMFTRAARAYIEAEGSRHWIELPAVPIAEAGFADDDALINFPSRSHAAYRLLTEYFAFPEKFNFFDVDIAAIARAAPAGCTSVVLHLALRDIRSDSNLARLLGGISPDNLVSGCTPVINLFRQRGDPIRLSHTVTSYPVLADSRRAYAYEVHAIESVRLVRQTSQGESITEFRPFYSLRHGEAPEQAGHYWIMRRDEMIGAKSPGYETEISVVDIDFDPAAVEIDTLSIDLTCSNRDLPSRLSVGMAGGDLFLEGGSLVRSIRFMRKPTTPMRLSRGKAVQWRLISLLALNHLSLSSGGLDAFKEMLMLHDLARSPISQRQIGAVTGFDSQPATAWLPGNPFPSLVRGVEVRLTVDTEGFVGTALHLFAGVIDRFLGLYVNLNSFTRLVVICHRSGEELLRCPPRSGDLSLA